MAWGVGLHFAVEALLLALVVLGATQEPPDPPVLPRWEYVDSVGLVASKLQGRRDIAAAIMEHKGDFGWRLIVGVIKTENPWLLADTVNWYGATGLMQVVPRLWLGRYPECGTDLTNVRTNICYGAQVLRWHIRVAGSLDQGLADYSGHARGYVRRVYERGEL